MAGTLYGEEYSTYLENIGVSQGHEDRMKEMLADKTKREKDWRNDLMSQERAGMDEDDKKLIPQLDASNNERWILSPNSYIILYSYLVFGLNIFPPNSLKSDKLKMR